MRKTVLLVDDEEIVRRMTRAALSGPDDPELLEAASAEDALEIAHAFDGPIDLLLSDVVMPGMTGTEMAARLCQSRPETQVLLMSGYESHAISLQEDWQFIPKPFGVREIRERVRDILARAHFSPREGSRKRVAGEIGADSTSPPCV